MKESTASEVYFPILGYCKLVIFSLKNSNSIDEESRIGNTDVVHVYQQPIQTFSQKFTKRLCCRDTNVVPDELFEGF